MPSFSKAVLASALAVSALTLVAVEGHEFIYFEQLLPRHEAQLAQAPSPSSEAPATTTKDNAQSATTPPAPVKPEVDNAPAITTPPTEPEPVPTSAPAEQVAKTPTEEPIEVVVVDTRYATPPLAFDEINERVLPSLVNILCPAQAGSPVVGATGSGIIIDSRGVILTNAHIAQYLLLESHEEVQTQCVIRTGAPARERYRAELLAFPRTWLAEHGATIRDETQRGTGEHDWALLYITQTTDGSQRPESFPSVPTDLRQHVARTNEEVLLAGYPAGFIGSTALRSDFWSVTTVTHIKKIFTFEGTTPDLLDLGGSIIAQNGSSGGGVFNEWGYLVGLIVTSSLADTTDERDLRAVTLSHINESVVQHAGRSLPQFLTTGNFEQKVAEFNREQLPTLLPLFAI